VKGKVYYIKQVLFWWIFLLIGEAYALYTLARHPSTMAEFPDMKTRDIALNMFTNDWSVIILVSFGLSLLIPLALIRISHWRYSKRASRHRIGS